MGINRYASMQRNAQPLSERKSSQENSQGEKSKDRVKRQAHKVATKTHIDSIAISDDELESTHELEQSATSMQDSDEDDFAVLSEPLPLFDQSGYSTASDRGGAVADSAWVSAGLPRHSFDTSAHILNHFSDDSDSDDADEEDTSFDVTHDESIEEQQLRGVPASVAHTSSDSPKDEPQDDVGSEDDETDLNVLRLRGHLSAFACSASKPSFRRVESGPSAAATKMLPPSRNGLTKKTQSAPVGKAAWPPVRKSPAKPTRKGKAPNKSHADVAGKQDAQVGRDNGSNDQVKKPKRTAAKKKVAKAESADDQPEKTPDATSELGSSEPTDDSSPTKRKRSPVKRRPKTPPPEPVDLSNLPAAHLLIVTGCPLCGESFPKYKSSTVRRRHVGVCAAKQSLTADSVIVLISEEVARLDKAERASRAHEEELKTTLQLVIEASRMEVRHVEEEEWWDALGVPWESSRRKTSAAAKGAVSLGETSAVKRRKLAGGTGCLLLPPAQSQKEAVRRSSSILDLPVKRNGHASDVKSEGSLASDAHPDGIDFDTGDVVADVSEPVFAFPVDQRLAEMRFLATQVPADHPMATQPATQFPYDMNFNPNVLASLPPGTQTFTQAPSATFRARSASRLWRRRKAVPGAGVGLGTGSSPLVDLSLL